MPNQLLVRDTDSGGSSENRELNDSRIDGMDIEDFDMGCY